jgi:hypothetical protein
LLTALESNASSKIRGGHRRIATKDDAVRLLPPAPHRRIVPQDNVHLSAQHLDSLGIDRIQYEYPHVSPLISGFFLCGIAAQAP